MRALRHHLHGVVIDNFGYEIDTAKFPIYWQDRHVVRLSSGKAKGVCMGHVLDPVRTIGRF